jgi:hypothetical protein
MEIRRTRTSGTSQWNSENFEKEEYYEPDNNKWLGMAYKEEGSPIEVSLETSRLPQSVTEGLPVESTGLAKFQANSFEEVGEELKRRGLEVIDGRRKRF